MPAKNGVPDQPSILEQIIDGASQLPLENQRMLLVLAKGMAYTRSCLVREGMDDPPLTPPIQHPV